MKGVVWGHLVRIGCKNFRLYRLNLSGDFVFLFVTRADLWIGKGLIAK
jgi:hypothetical protein